MANSMNLGKDLTTERLEANATLNSIGKTNELRHWSNHRISFKPAITNPEKFLEILKIGGDIDSCMSYYH